MRNFQDSFQTPKQSFISAFSIYMTASLIFMTLYFMGFAYFMVNYGSIVN